MPYLVDGNVFYVQVSTSDKSVIASATWVSGGGSIALTAGGNYFVMFSHFKWFSILIR